MFKQLINHVRDCVQKYKCSKGIHVFGEYSFERYDPHRDTALFYSYCKCGMPRSIMIYRVKRKLNIPKDCSHLTTSSLYELLNTYYAQAVLTDFGWKGHKIVR